MNINGTQNRAISTASRANNALPTPAKLVQTESETPVQQDSVTLSTDDSVEENQKSRHHKLSRMIRKGFLSAASTGMAALNSILSIPVGMQIGLDTLKDQADPQAPATEIKQAEGQRSLKN